MAETKAVFVVETQSNASAILAKDAASAREFEAEIDKLSKKNTELRDTQKQLVGSSSDVKDARQKIGAAMKSNLDDIGKLKLAQLKAGNLKSSTAGADDAKAQSEAKAEAIKKEADAVAQKQKAASQAAAGDAEAAAQLKEVAGAALGAATAVVAVSAALIAGAVSVTKWVVNLADGARNLRLQREALMGSSQQAQVLDEWQQKLVQSTGISQDTVAGYATTLGKARLQGKEYTGSLEAITMAQAAMGDTLAGKITELTTRQAKMGVFTLGRFELDGTGLQTADVAAALAKNTKVSLADAQRALASGRLPLVKGAEAIRDAVKAKFGKNIAEKAISIDSLKNKAEAKLGQFAKGINIDKLLAQADKLLVIFDTNTVAGKMFMSAVNTAIDVIAKGAAVVVPKLIDGFELGGFAVALIENKTVALYLAIQDAADEFDRIVASAGKIGDEIKSAVSSALSFETVGASISQGLAHGMRSKSGEVQAAGASLYKAADTGIRTAGDVHSPSREAMKIGGYVAQGTADGITQGTSRVSDAALRLGDAAMPSIGGSGGGSPAGGGGAQYTFNINMPVSAMSSIDDFQKPAFKQALIRVLRDSLAQGVPG